MVDRHLGCLHIFATSKWHFNGPWGYICLSIVVSFGYIPNSGFLVSCGSFIPKFPKNLLSVLHPVAFIYIPNNSADDYLFSTPSTSFMDVRLYISLPGCTRTLLSHVVSSSLIGNQTWDPCIGIMGS